MTQYVWPTHDQNTCMVSKDIFQQVNDTNKDGPSDLNNYVGEWPDMININISNYPNEKDKGVKWKGLDLATIARDLAPKPSQEEIRRRISEKDSVTYQWRGIINVQMGYGIHD